jgi:glycosyltransferase involved in cell wall biosynthesis
MRPLVSILIPAYNAEAWIAGTIDSALSQSWERKEIIVVDDGSRDNTVSVAQRFCPRGVKVLTQQNQGASTARNKAFAECTGDYIQWLDADDLIAPDKIERQVIAAERLNNRRFLLSAAFGSFAYRTSHARFQPTALWCDLGPAEWILRSMEQNIYIQTTAWLASRELVTAAGPWDPRLSLDDDGEFFMRVILASEGVQFVPEAKAYYRRLGRGCLSHLDASNKKWESQFLSIQLHLEYLRKLPQTDRLRRAAVRYLQDWVGFFYPGRTDLFERMQLMAGELGGHLEPGRLPWKYAIIQRLFGWDVAKRAQSFVPGIRWSLRNSWDRAWFRIGDRHRATS